MTAQEIVKIYNELPSDKQNEITDFMQFLKYQTAKERILNADQEEKEDFESVDQLMESIENFPDED